MKYAIWSLMFVAACGGEERARPSAEPTPKDAAPLFGAEPTAPMPPAEEAKRIWETACVSCHGAEGRGDGSIAGRLNPPPRDHSDPAWQDSVTDEEIAAVIVQGGLAVGKSQAMPARADLAQKPEVLAELVRRVRGFRR